MTSHIDNILAGLIESGRIQGYEVMPSLMSQWRTKDAGNKNSDNGLSAHKDVYVASTDAKANHNPSVGRADNVRNSIRQALPYLVPRM